MFGGRGVALGGGGLGVAGVVIYLLVAYVGGGGRGSRHRRARPAGSHGQRPRPTTRPAAHECRTGKDAEQPRLRRGRRHRLDPGLLGRRAPRLGRPTRRCRRCGSPARCHRLRQRRQRRRAVLLPGRQEGLHRPDASTTTSSATSVPRAARSSTPTCWRTSTATTCRTCWAPRPRCAPRSGPAVGLGAAGVAGRLLRRRVGEPRDNEPTAAGPAADLDITADDIYRGLDAASRIGDDYIQKNLGGGPSTRRQFTHGTSAQRRKWFTTGYGTGSPSRCDTFGTDNLG